MFERNAQYCGVGVVLLPMVTGVAGSQQLERQGINVVLKFMDFIDRGRVFARDGIELSDCLTDIARQFLAHWSCKRVDRDAEQRG